jgi:hypothetical protein
MRRDAVTPEMREAVFDRDREAVADFLAEMGWTCEWRRDRLVTTMWGRTIVVCPAVIMDRDALGGCGGRWRIEHVKRQARLGRRAEPQMDRLMALCSEHTEDGMRGGHVWATSHRDDERGYLAQVNKEHSHGIV